MKVTAVANQIQVWPGALQMLPENYFKEVDFKAEKRFLYLL